MKDFHSVEELMNQISNMNSNNSVCQFRIPGKGRFTLVLQEDEVSIATEIENNPELKRMIQESREEYKAGLGISGEELFKSFSAEDFD